MGIIERFGRIADTYMEERNQLLKRTKSVVVSSRAMASGRLRSFATPSSSHR